MARDGKGSLRVNVQNLAECKHEEGLELGAGHAVPVAGVERVADEGGHGVRCRQEEDAGHDNSFTLFSRLFQLLFVSLV